MTSTAPTSDGPTTAEEFHAELRRLVRAAETNSVDIEGGWACRGMADDSSWDIEIVSVRQTP